jgi:outer membrane protein OmpA-like peptidoglycan-associated protein
MTHLEAISTNITRPGAVRCRRVTRVLFCVAGFLLPSCAALNGPLDFDSDESGDMQQHPRRTEMPSLMGPDKMRVQPGKFPVVQFAGSGWKLAPAETAKIRGVARWMTGNPERVLVAAGARAESPEYARQLSDLRAQTVRRALVSAGVPDEKILTVSFGEDAPPATGQGVSFSIVRTGESR